MVSREVAIFAFVWIVTLPLIPLVVIRLLKKIKGKGIKSLETLAWILVTGLIWFAPSLSVAVYRTLTGKINTGFLIILGILFLFSLLGFVRLVSKVKPTKKLL